MVSGHFHVFTRNIYQSRGEGLFLDYGDKVLCVTYLYMFCLNIIVGHILFF